MSPKCLKIAIFSFERVEHACAYIRLLSPLEAISHAVDYAWGVSKHHYPFLRKKIIRTSYIDFADIVVVQRNFPQKKTSRILKAIITSGKPVIYETDDLLFDLPREHILRQAWEKHRPYMLEFMRHVDAITVSTPTLGEAVRRYNPNVQVLPNLIDDKLWAFSGKNITGKIVIGFSGSSTHAGDIAMIEEALLAIARLYGDRITFKFLGCVTDRLASLPCFEFMDFQPSYRHYARALMNAGVDIAIVPLEDTHFNRCKSNIKWLEYSACGIPGIYSDISPYNTCVTHGRTGVLAGGSTRQWVEALELLISREEVRRTMGMAAQQDVLANFSLSKKARIYSDFYRGMLQDYRQTDRQTDRQTGWAAFKTGVMHFFNKSPFRH